ncbi:unnamed protein product [Caenorhabditis bovis]|uniref:Uncharacterized protein n=1 Tax=Caenorhabditis bovis TaxID=2654633 RepID=A0A8S1EZ70_9PELO|nr:unnamed protein product [Caenorhabditis bovis]
MGCCDSRQARSREEDDDDDDSPPTPRRHQQRRPHSDSQSDEKKSDERKRGPKKKRKKKYHKMKKPAPSRMLIEPKPRRIEKKHKHRPKPIVLPKHELYVLPAADIPPPPPRDDIYANLF